MAERFIERKDNIKDNLTQKYLFDFDNKDRKYRVAVTMLNRFWEGYSRVKTVNQEILADREMILQKIDQTDLKKTKKNDLIELIEEIERILQ